MSLFDTWNAATGAILGSFVGAMGSTVSAWVTQRHAERRELLAMKISQRERLYSQFIRESAQVLVDAAQHSLQEPSKLVPLYSLLSRIRLSSSAEVIGSAEQVTAAILRAYSGPNLTSEEIQSRATGNEDPLRGFSDICRRELDSMWSGS